MLGEEVTIERAIDNAAAAQPSIAESVSRAKAIQALSSREDAFDAVEVESGTGRIFISNWVVGCLRWTKRLKRGSSSAYFF